MVLHLDIIFKSIDPMLDHTVLLLPETMCTAVPAPVTLNVLLTQIAEAPLPRSEVRVVPPLTCWLLLFDWLSFFQILIFLPELCNPFLVKPRVSLMLPYELLNLILVKSGLNFELLIELLQMLDNFILLLDFLNELLIVFVDLMFNNRADIWLTTNLLSW